MVMSCTATGTLKALAMGKLSAPRTDTDRPLSMWVALTPTTPSVAWATNSICCWIRAIVGSLAAGRDVAMSKQAMARMRVW